MELYQLRYFAQVAKFESISKAARTLNVSQPALSKAIAKLEVELGAQLFDRAGKRLYLNERGGYFLQGVERALGELNEAASVVGGLSADVAGSLSLGVFGPQSEVAGCVAQFMKDNPLHHVTIDARQNLFPTQALQDYDLVFYPDTPSFSRIAGIAYAAERTFAVVSKKHPLSSAARARLSQFKDEPFIFTNTTTGVYERCYKLCIDSGFIPNVRAVTSSGAVQRKLIEEGLGVGFADVSNWQSLQGGGTVCIELVSPSYEQTLCFASRPVKRLSPSARRFLSFAMDYFGVPENNATLARLDENDV